MYIYKITNITNNKIYIGLTTNSVEQRWKEHIRSSRNQNKKSKLYNAIRKYGANNFNVEIIDTANNITELNQKEKFWIEFYNSTNKNTGYNICEGGNAYGGLVGSKNGMFGKHHSPDTIEKIRKALKGKKQSKIAREHMKEGQQKRLQYEKEHNIVRHNSERCKELIREQAIKRHSNPEYRLKTSLNCQKNMNNSKLLTCPHCGFQSKSIGMMNRWHFDNCKPKKIKNVNQKFRETSLKAIEQMSTCKCIYCGFETKLKHIIDRFHNDNCKLKDPIFREKYQKLGKKKYSSFFIKKYFMLYKKGLF